LKKIYFLFILSNTCGPGLVCGTRVMYYSSETKASVINVRGKEGKAIPVTGREGA
jgi:hypothetical protein